MDLIEVDSPAGFSFFEQFAALVESEEDISFDAAFQLFSGAEAQALTELTEGYFQDMLDNIPEAETEFHALAGAIGQNLTGLAGLAGRDGAVEESLRAYAEEFFRFRDWFRGQSAVALENAVTGEESRGTILEALTLSRLEALGGDQHYYDFSDCMGYELEEYVFDPSAYEE